MYMWLDTSDSVLPESYTVQPNDTLSAIARKHGFKNWQELAKLQPAGFNPNKIKPEQEIILKKIDSVRWDIATGVKQVGKDQARAYAISRMSEITPMSHNELMQSFTEIDASISPVPEVIIKPMRPEWLSEYAWFTWDAVAHLWVDPSIFENQKMVRNTNGSVRITAPWTISQKMNWVLWDAINKFKMWEIDIPMNQELGKTLEDFSQREPKGNFILKEFAAILKGTMKKWIETPYDNLISQFHRNNVKHGYFSYWSVDAIPSEKKEEWINLLSQYAGSRNPGDIYNKVAERTLWWGDMHSIISYILMWLWWECETYGKMLQTRMKDGDLRWFPIRI